MRLTPEQAQKVLELVPGEAVSVRSIRAAFARRVKALHPDTATAPGPGVPILELQAARDLLLNGVAQQHNACTLCRGRGMVRGVMGWRECSACEGTGDKQ